MEVPQNNNFEIVWEMEMNEQDISNDKRLTKNHGRIVVDGRSESFLAGADCKVSVTIR